MLTDYKVMVVVFRFYRKSVEISAKNILRNLLKEIGRYGQTLQFGNQ